MRRIRATVRKAGCIEVSGTEEKRKGEQLKNWSSYVTGSLAKLMARFGEMKFVHPGMSKARKTLGIFSLTSRPSSYPTYYYFWLALTLSFAS